MNPHGKFHHVIWFRVTDVMLGEERLHERPYAHVLFTESTVKVPTEGFRASK